MHKDEDGLLEVFLIDGSVYYKKMHIKNRRISEGISSGTSFSAYGCGTRIGLFIIEDKKKINEKQPYMLTLAHYYVNSGSGGNFGGSGVDVGFSVVVKIGVHNGVLDFSVDGPVEHPSSALIYMIEEVTRTGTWKLSACPHCKNIQWQQRKSGLGCKHSRINSAAAALFLHNDQPCTCSTLVHGFTSYKTAVHLHTEKTNHLPLPF